MASWDQIGGGLVNAGMGLFSSNQAVGAANDAATRAQGADALRRNAYSSYAGQLQGLAPQIEQGYTMKPATATTGFATSQIDPNTGKVGYQLTAPAQGLFSKALGGAQSSLNLAGNFDPEAMAAKRFAAQQKLLAPQRAAEDAQRAADLQRRGLTGVGTFAGSTTGNAMNPYEAAAQNARAQADAQASYNSLNEGENYLNNLIGRSQNLANYAGGIDTRGQQALNTAGDWTNRFTQNNVGKTNALTGLFTNAFNAQRQAAYDPTSQDKILAAQKAADAASVNRTQGFTQPAAGALSGLLGSGGLNLFGKIGGLFGSGYSVPQAGYGTVFDNFSTDYSNVGGYNPSDYSGWNGTYE